MLGGLRDKNFKFRCIYVPIRLDILPITQQQAEKKMFVVTKKIMSLDKLQKNKDMRSWVQTGLVLRHKAFLLQQEQDC